MLAATFIDNDIIFDTSIKYLTLIFYSWETWELRKIMS